MRKTHNKESFLATTLIFAYPKGKNWQAEMRHYVIKDGTLKDIKKQSDNIGIALEKKLKSQKCQYVGIYDNYKIYGRLGVGTVVGYSTYKSFKTEKKGATLIASKRELDLCRYNYVSPHNEYIAEMVYFLGAPMQYSLRRTLVFDMVVAAPDKQDLEEKACGLAVKCIQELNQLLIKNRIPIEGDLKFLGLKSLQFMPERLGVGKCFSLASKEFRRLTDIQKLISTVEKLAKKK
jgi:hypothetical protein